jgi:hypothetical protein
LQNLVFKIAICAKLFTAFVFRSVLLAVYSVLVFTPVAQASLAKLPPNQQWVLQLGYFAQRQNALNLKQVMTEAGFEVQVLATGKPGKQRYRLVSMAVDDKSELSALKSEIASQTGTVGYPVQGLLGDAVEEEPFSPPRSKYLVAQAGLVNGTGGGGSVAGSNSYDPMLNRTPQETVESAAGFTAGGFQIIPTIGLSIGYDDNVTSSSRDEISSTFYMISPAIRAEMPTDHSVFSLIAGLDIVRYQDSTIDNRDYWYIRGEWAWDISTRQNLNLFGQYSEGSDRRGEGRRQGDVGLIPLEPDQWNRWDLGGEWDYGAVGARGRLTLRAGLSDLTYTNNRGNEDFAGTRALDRDSQFIGGTFYVRVAPKSSLFVDYLYTDINYELETGSDSVEQSWMAGVTWDASARTSGRVSYGKLTKEFDDPDRHDYSGPTWRASISWRPRTYSVFTLSGVRNTQEPDGNGDYVLRQDIALSWVHDWATRFGTSVDVGFGQDEYRPTDRVDDLFYWGVAARYTFNAHFRFGASINSYDRNSEIEEFDYTRTVYMLSLEATY